MKIIVFLAQKILMHVKYVWMDTSRMKANVMVRNQQATEETNIHDRIFLYYTSLISLKYDNNLKM